LCECLSLQLQLTANRADAYFAPPQCPSAQQGRPTIETQQSIEAILTTIFDDPLPRLVAQELHVNDGKATATQVAESLNLSSRYALARRMRTACGISFVEIRQWLAVDTLLRMYESAEASACAMALSELKDPATFYRLVRRLTGHSWSEVRHNGSAWLMGRFAERCSECRAKTVSPAEELQLGHKVQGSSGTHRPGAA